jgi:hypothetical protein
MPPTSVIDAARRRWLAAAAWLVGQPALAQTRGSASVKLELDLPPRRYLRRELVPLRVRLRNESGVALSLPRLSDSSNAQPVFTVEGPSFARPFVFTPRAGLPPAMAASVPAGRTDTRQNLAPGATLQQVFDLGRLVPFGAAGPHSVRVRLEWDGQVLEAGPLTFEIALPRVLSARLMLDDGFQRPNPVRALCLVDDGHEKALVLAFFREIAPDFAAAELSYLLRVAPADPGADEALPTWTNYPRGDIFLQRQGWRSPSRIGIESSHPTDRASAADPAMLRLQPALMTRDGVVDVLQWRDGALVAWQFPAPVRDGGPAVPHLRWQLPQQAALAGRAARAPESRGSALATLLIARSAAGLALTLVEATGATPRSRSVELRSARLLPSSEPALHVDAKGRVHAALVVASDNALRRIHCADIVWPAGGGDAHVESGASVDLPAAATATTAAFDTGGGARRQWAALLSDGRVMHGGTAATVAGRPYVPLQLALLGEHDYLLVQGADGVPALEALG